MVTGKYVATNPANEEITITIKIGSPEFDEGDFRCRLSILALEIDEYIYGIDPIQSYCLVSKRLKILFNDFISEGWNFYFPGHIGTDMQIDFLNGYF